MWAMHVTNNEFMWALHVTNKALASFYVKGKELKSEKLNQ